jgi:hypothetical protein
MGKERCTYGLYFLKNVPGALRYKLAHKMKNCTRFRGQKGITLDYSNEVLRSYISAGKPFAAIHFGGTELGAINAYEKIRLGYKKNFKEAVKYSMKNNAGFYPSDDIHLRHYGEAWIKECGNADILGIMGLHMEDYFQKKYLPHAKIIQYEGMEPLHGSWTELLKGKKVLVISPFTAEIEAQYAKREKLFLDEPSILPEFELKLLTSPLTLGDEKPVLPTFFDGLDQMKEAIRGIDFDIALVGCGAYTAFLCCFIKSIGKMAIETGGATSTLFGIMGKRWEKREHVAKHVNSDWIRPYNKAAGFDKIEGGAYW